MTVTVAHKASDFAVSQSFSQDTGSHFSAMPSPAILIAGLVVLECVDAPEPDLDAVDSQAVAIDDVGFS